TVQLLGCRLEGDVLKVRPAPFLRHDIRTEISGDFLPGHDLLFDNWEMRVGIHAVRISDPDLINRTHSTFAKNTNLLNAPDIAGLGVKLGRNLDPVGTEGATREFGIDVRVRGVSRLVKVSGRKRPLRNRFFELTGAIDGKPRAGPKYGEGDGGKEKSAT